jgi:hypothetical protein
MGEQHRVERIESPDSGCCGVIVGPQEHEDLDPRLDALDEGDSVDRNEPPLRWDLVRSTLGGLGEVECPEGSD